MQHHLKAGGHGGARQRHGVPERGIHEYGVRRQAKRDAALACVCVLSAQSAIAFRLPCALHVFPIPKGLRPPAQRGCEERAFLGSATAKSVSTSNEVVPFGV